MKVLIDMDKLIEELKALEEDKRGQYLLQSFRELAGYKEPRWATVVKTATKCPDNYTDAFEEFWKLYPSRGGSKTGKKPAFKAWWKMADGDEKLLLNLCKKALDWQIYQEQWTRDNGNYIPMASTYLNQERFLDEQLGPKPDGRQVLGPDGEWRTA